MADSWTEMGWVEDRLGHNGPKGQIREYKRQIRWLEGGHRKRLERELKDIPNQVRTLKLKIAALECPKPQ